MKHIRQAGNISEKPVFPKKCWRREPLYDKASGVSVRIKPLFAGRHVLAMLLPLISQGFSGIGSNFGKPLSHYQDAARQMIFRYDNSQHRPLLPHPDHKHTPERVFCTLTPTLEDVLSEIVISKGWGL